MKNLRPNLCIFLDMDGVLWTKSWSEMAYKFEVKCNMELDPRAVALFERLLKLLGCKVVMVSTWKHGCSVIEINKELNEKGCNFRIDDKTEDLIDRPREITDFCKKHNIEDYIIIDDESYDNEHSENIVQTFCNTGFTIHEFKEVLNKVGVFKDARTKFRESKNNKK